MLRACQAMERNKSRRTGFRAKSMFMKWQRGILGMLAALVIASAALAQGNATAAERSLFESVNRERKVYGLPALKWDEALATAARQHAREMARRNSVAHNLPGEPTLPSRATKAGAHFGWLSENVISSDSGPAAHAQFMKSPNHRANILDSDMDSVGIGVAERDGQLFVVEDFSKAK
jgi:uncharacterized protein YkwD